MGRKPRGGMRARLSQSFARIPPEDTPRIYRIRLDEIDRNPEQPRRRFDAAGLRELAATIARHGLLQPVTVKRTDGGRYLLVSGERRLRAHEILGREEILAVLTAGNPDEIALIENVQRQDLHPLEEAAAYARMMARHGWTQEEVAEVVGKARPTIANVLKLNDLPEAIRAECSTSNVSKSVLLEIARAPGPAAQLRLWRRVRDGSTTVRAARATKRGQGPAPRARRREAAGTIAAGRTFARRLEGLSDAYLAAHRADYAALVALARRIERRLDAARQALDEPAAAERAS